MASMKKTAKPRKPKNQVFGIDDMVNAISEELASNPDVPASAKEATKKAVKTILQLEQNLIQGAVADGNQVNYVGFGGWKPSERKERQGRNPQTGEEITIKATVVPAFKPGKQFKDTVKESLVK